MLSIGSVIFIYGSYSERCVIYRGGGGGDTLLGGGGSEVHMNLLFDCSLFLFIARMTAQNVVMRTGTRF